MEIERFIVSKGIIINYISLRFDEVFFFLPFLLPGKLAKQREIQLTATKKGKKKSLSVQRTTPAYLVLSGSR